MQSGTEEAEQPLFDRLRLLAAIADFHRHPPSTSEHTASGPTVEQANAWGHLRMLERIGCGAFGEVYRAWDTRLDREVALKLLPAESSLADTRVTSIIEEGRLLARVRHPNVVTIYGAERTGDRVGLWMEFIDGRTLADIVQHDGVLTADRVADIGIELCRAVDAVHKAGLLHRDIKAQNVMLAADGRVVLMDFGTGRELGDGAADLAGTPLYLAPELLAGEKATVAGDIYSVGVLLYYLLTGSYPVRAADIRGLLLAHQRRERTEIQTARPEVPTKLARVIERAIETRPQDRYRSAEALASGLTALRPQPRAIRLTYAVACATALALVVWLGTRPRDLEDRRASGVPSVHASAVPAETSAAQQRERARQSVLAVLPFKNVSGDAENDYFVDGITAEIIRNLAVIDGLDVRSEASSFFFKDKPRNLREVEKQLDAGLVMEGSVLRVGNRLQFQVQLVRAAGDVRLWSERFDRNLVDVFAIQDEITRAVVRELRLTPHHRQRRYNADVGAHDLYLKARALVDRQGVGAREGAGLFRQVIAEDPDFAPAYAGLAYTYALLLTLPYRGTISYPTAKAVMRPAAVRALQLDPFLAEAHGAMGFVCAIERRWTDAEKSFRRAIELNRTLTQTYTSYAFSTLRPLGRLDEAERILREALRSDPLSLDIRREMAGVHFEAGRYKEAIAELEQVKAIDPQFPFVDRYLGRALAFDGRLAEAIELLERDGPFDLAFPYVHAGRRSEVEQMAITFEGHPLREARIYAALGDNARAIKGLERAVIAEPYRVAQILAYPEMAALRTDPRAAGLRKTLNLPDNTAGAVH